MKIEEKIKEIDRRVFNAVMGCSSIVIAGKIVKIILNQLLIDGFVGDKNEH